MSRSELADAINQVLDRLYPGRNLAAFYVDFRWVGKLERGETRWPTEERRAALREVFNVESDLDIDLYSPRWTGALDQGHDAVRHRKLDAHQAELAAEALILGEANIATTQLRRRSMLFGMAAVVSAAGLAGPESGHRRRIGATDLSRLNAVTTLYRSVDHEFGGGMLVDDLGKFAESATGLLDHVVSDALRPHLLTAISNARYLAGWTAFDATRHADAQRHFAAAERYAVESGDRRLLAYVRYGQAKQLQHLRHNRDALHTLQAAHHGLDPTPGILAILHGAEAASRAALGDAEGARRALGQSSEAFGAVRPGEEPEWMGFLDLGELLAQYGRVYRDFARADRRYGDDAVRWVDDAIASFDPENVRSSVLNQVGLCSAYFLAGAPELAVQAGRAAQQLATELTSQRVVERIANLRRDAADHLDRPDVVEFLHDLPSIQPQRSVC
ncbi:hypothetical protein [Actinoplanes sp. NBC_00393]|uniref:hypothetical protein n=1 Tax=Actinoplanes sp. NBC_00393 TaxID=2975953 RepID=UPI003FA4D2C7